MLALRSVRVPAVAAYRDGTVRSVLVEWPLVKGEPQLYHDAEGSYRWITVHPRGDDEAGVPVKIRESKTQRGVWHVVGGAGGKLNYLKLTNVKSPEEYKQRAAEKRRERKEAEAVRAQEQKARREAMSPEEREAEAADKAAAQAHKESLADNQRLQAQEFIKKVADLVGWTQEDISFEDRAARLKAAGSSDERIEQMEQRHFDRLFKRAEAVVKQTKRQILLDHEMRAEAGLGEVPLTTQDDSLISLADLDPDKAEKGLGYQQERAKKSDTEIVADLAKADVEDLRGELKAATEVGDDAPQTKAREQRLREELRIAQLAQQAAEAPREELEARETELRAALAETAKTMASLPALEKLHKQLDNAGKVDQAQLTEMLDALGLAGAGNKDPFARLAAIQQDLVVASEQHENLRRNLEDVRIMLGVPQPAVRAERKELSVKRQREREDEIRAEEGQEGVDRYRQMLAMLEQGRQKYLREMQAYKTLGLTEAPKLDVKPVTDAAAAAELLQHHKQFSIYSKKVKEALEDDEGKSLEEALKVYGKGYFVETKRAAVDKKIRDEIESELAQIPTRALLREVDRMHEEDPTFQTLSDTDKRKALERHLSLGTYNALNNAALTITGQGVLSREVVDTLGAAGAAQLLAHVIRSSRSKEDLDAVAEGVGDYHVAHLIDASEEAVRTASQLYADAKEMALEHADKPSDLAVMQRINGERREKLETAREVLGRTLGELEAMAALHTALKGSKSKDLYVALGPVGNEAAIRQARSIGLGRNDYVLDSDGVNRFLTIKPEAFDKLATKVDPEEQQVRDEVAAIKAGERDEDGWIPPGLVSRPATTFTDPAKRPRRYADNAPNAVPFEKWGTGGDLRGDVLSHLGARLADGEDPADVLPDVLSQTAFAVPAQHRSDVVKLLNELMPERPVTDAHGKPVWKKVAKRGADGNIVNGADGAPVMEIARGDDGKPIQVVKRLAAHHYTDTWDKVANDYVQAHVAPTDAKAATLHSQSLGLTQGDLKANDGVTAAMHHALADDPRAAVAFRPVAELTHDEQAALRHYFASTIAKLDAKTGVNQAEIDRKVAELGAEPPEEIAGQGGLFGGGGPTKNPEWLKWKQAKDQILADNVMDKSTGWDEYTYAMGGTRRAYTAIQERLKHDFLQRFHQRYSAITGNELRAGKQPMAHRERHLSFTDPEERERIRRERAQFQDKLRNRLGGKYAEGEVLSRMDLARQAEEQERQSQATMLFGGGGKQAERKEPPVGPGDRYTLGRRVEAELASLMPNVARNFRGHLNEPVGLFPNFSMSGKGKIAGTEVDLTQQQRTVKAFLARKRLGAFLGAGSGKTPIAIGSFTAAASDPSTGVKRGLFVVRSNNLGQFHGEFARFVQPGKFNWAANPGADHEGRMTSHRDPDTHMVTVTHESFRDDMMKVMGQHHGKTGDELRSWFMGLSRPDRAKALKEAWQKEGIDYQAAFLDEGHVTLDRQGKPDSLLSALMTAASDNTSHYMAMTADPLKNDISEMRSQLDKLHPDGRYGDENAWQARYGTGTTASADALRREVQSNCVVSAVNPPIEARKRRETVPLSDWQKQEYDKVTQLAGKLRADRSAGRINVEVAKQLSPGSFKDQPESEHENIARRISDAVGTIKEAAYHRIVNMADPDKNGKTAWIKNFLKTHDPKGKPVVIFHHNPSQVEAIAEALKADGHRVTTMHGEHSTAEKDKRRQMFQPPKGKDPEADILLLSDAGATGLNLQRGQTLIQVDMPMTGMTHYQRQGRINRLGQAQDVDLVDLVSDTDFDKANAARVDRKYALKDIFTDSGESTDETGLSHFISKRRAMQNQHDPTLRRAA